MSIKIAGKAVGPIGFGMAGLAHPFKPLDPQDAIAVMKAALEAGATFWNAGEIYGSPQFNSLHLLNAYFTKYPEDAEKVVISVKGCFDLKAARAHNDKEGVQNSIENCLKILDGKCRIDLFETARIDPNVPVEETISAIADFVKAGKVGAIGLSECSAATIRRAAAVHPIANVEIELSLFETNVLTNGVADACMELGIPIAAYSPLSRGFLTGHLRKYEDLPDGDFRRLFPRFQPEVFDQNLELVREVEQIAKQKGCSVVQVAIAWVSAQSRTIGVPVIPIPGASAISRVQENMIAVNLTEKEISEIDKILQRIEIQGGRVPSRFAHFLDN